MGVGSLNTHESCCTVLPKCAYDDDRASAPTIVARLQGVKKLFQNEQALLGGWVSARMSAWRHRRDGISGWCHAARQHMRMQLCMLSRACSTGAGIRAPARVACAHACTLTTPIINVQMTFLKPWQL